MAPENIDRIKEFPADGQYWWIRWVDHYRVPHGRTGTPSVEVALSPLPAHPNRLSARDLWALITDPTKPTKATLLAGTVPRLGLGRVFCDGVEVGDIPTEVRTFTLDLRELPPELMAAGDQIPHRPDGWDPDKPYRVINSYRLGHFLDSKCWVGHSGSDVVVLPCHEVFRAMLAPETEIALALIGEPWPRCMERLTDPECTGAVKDSGSWHLVLRTLVHDTSQWHLANLFCTEAGKKAAKTVYASMLASRGPASIVAPIPFDTPEIRFAARCVRLHRNPDKFLILEILRLTWPYGNQDLKQRRENGAEDGKEVIPTDDPPPYVRVSKPALRALDETPIGVTAEDDPNSATPTIRFCAHRIVWDNAPPFGKIEKDKSYRYIRRSPSPEADPPEEASAGNRTGGDTGKAPAAYVAGQREKLTRRFEDVIEMLERLRVGYKIDHWRALPSPEVTSYRGDHPVWRLPQTLPDDRGVRKYQAWSRLDRDANICRTALVCEVVIAGATVHWIEIELRPNEGGRRSLICSLRANDRDKVIKKILTLAVAYKATWPSPATIVSETHALDIEPWTHQYAERPERAVLREDLALRRMQKLIGVSRNAPVMLDCEFG